MQVLTPDTHKLAQPAPGQVPDISTHRTEAQAGEGTEGLAQPEHAPQSRSPRSIPSLLHPLRFGTARFYLALAPEHQHQQPTTGSSLLFVSYLLEHLHTSVTSGLAHSSRRPASLPSSRTLRQTRVTLRRAPPSRSPSRQQPSRHDGRGWRLGKRLSWQH